MWTAQALMKSGEVRPLATLMVEGRHALTRELVELARREMAQSSRTAPWRTLDAVIESPPTPWAEAIPFWASEANLSSGGFSVRRSNDQKEDVIVESEEHGIQAWNHPTAVAIPIPSEAMEIAIDYEWDRATAIPRFVEYGLDSEGELLPSFDGRLYAGEESVILETDSSPTMVSIPRELLQDRHPQFRWVFRVANRAGLLIGRIARRLVRRPSPIVNDPGFVARLLEEESHLAEPNKCPRIDAVSKSSADPLVLVVHGTFSCSVEIATRISQVCPNARVARFEHDTFLPLSQNVTDLICHLARLAEAGQEKVLLVAHSRGGLVACQAASLARTLFPKLKLKVWTAGTPHFGTPLAGTGGIAAQALGALYRFCARAKNGVFRATYVEGAAAYLTAVGQLPPGVSVMREGSDFLDLHRLHVQQVSPRTWGAHCDPAGSGAVGHGLLLPPIIAEFFDQRPNDLVVPTASAILDGSTPINGCSHFHYFDQSGLAAIIDNF